MSTRISIQIEPIVHGDTQVTNTGLVVKPIEPGDTFSGMKVLDVPLVDASVLTAVNVFYIKDSAATVNLKCSVTRLPAAVPSTPVLVSDPSPAAYALAGASGQQNALAILTDLSSLTGIVQNDMLGIGISRDSGDTGTFLVVRIEFVLSSPVVLNVCDIITLDEAKSFLNIAGTDLDAFLQKWITIFSKGAEEYCGRKFRLQTILAETQDGSGTFKQFTFWAPINGFVHDDITQDILFRFSPVMDFAPLEADARFIFINQQEPFYILMYRRIFYDLVQNIKMNYTAGYASIPSRVVEVIFEMMQVLLKKSRQKAGEDLLMTRSTSRNEAGVTFNTVFRDLKPEHQAVLNELRRQFV